MNNKYQGREFTGTMGAPTKEDLEDMLDELQEFASESGLEPVEVLDIRPDPDGGWEATVRAHNWNPLRWIKEKMKRKPGGPEKIELLPRGTTESEPEENRPGWARRATAAAAGKVRERIEERRRKKKEQEELGWYEYGREHIPGFEAMTPQQKREALGKATAGISPGAFRRIPGVALKGKEERIRLETEASRFGVSPTATILVKKTVRHPETGTWETTWEPKQIPKPLAEVRKETLEARGREAAAGAFEHERRLQPVRTIADIVGRMVEPTIGPRRGIGVTPTGMARPELYRVRPPIPPTFRPSMGSLEHLRKMTIPIIRRPR